ncbi:MAG: choice-of-anchor D domain-containing protein [Bacteroidota bacterium]|nr:choice-of-anchor D domain-containing protein [Bacteroidota bacterium]MDP4231882.1 choice-of-anchor D domain-containing protein [Bacteroidota bacterium]
MNSWNKLRAALGLLVVLALSGSAFAQAGRVTRYTTTTFSGSYSSINGGSSFGSGDDNSYLCPQTLPFAFNYDSASYSAGQSIYVNTNGGMSFGNSQSGCCSDYVGNSTYQKFIMPDDFDGYIFGGLYYAVTGTAPNRVFTIEWYNFSPCCSNTNHMNMQVKLYETSNVIEMLYSSHSYAMGGGSMGTGLNGSSTPSFVYNRYGSSSTSSQSTDLRWTPPFNVPPAELSLSPKALNYGGVTSGSSLTLYDTAYSLGPNPLTLTSWNITGSTNFTVVSGPAPGASVPAGQYAVFGIQFSPTASGTLTGMFNLVTTGRDSGTQTCALNGIGAAAGVQYTFPTTVYPTNTLFHHVARGFGAVATQYITVQSTGIAALNFSSIYFTGLQANMYHIVHVPPNPLGSGLTDSIGVQFQPYLEGRPDAQLIINTNAINIPSDTVTLWGVGVLPHLVITPEKGLATVNGAGTLLFDSVAIGDSICKSLTLQNIGSDTLRITNQVVTYGDYDFTFYPLTGSDLILPPDASKIVNVCFKPIKQGARFASVRFYTDIARTYPDNRDTSQFLISVSGTGVPYGILSLGGTVLDSVLIDSTKCTSATIKNMGLSSMTVTTATISGSNNFTVSTTPPLPITLGAGQSQLIDICYTPTARGPEAATLVLTGTTSGRPLTQSLPLEGVGLAACLDAAPSPLAFGSAAYSGMTLANTENDTCITVTNCGDVSETFSAALSPDASSAYSLIAPFIVGPIAPGGTGTLCVAFKPDTIGIMPGSVIVSASEKSATAKTLPLAGTGAGVVIAGSGQGKLTSLTKCDTFAVTIQNTGNTPWTPGTGAVMSGANGPDFTAIGMTTPATIPAGGSGILMVQFCPTTSGTETAEMSFPTSSPAPLNGTVTLSAIGTSAGVTERTEQNGFSLGASYPNPTNGKADVIVTMPSQAKVTIALLNLQGSVVRTIYNGALNTGNNVVSLDARDLASGTYFVVLTSGDIRLTREMILSK